MAAYNDSKKIFYRVETDKEKKIPPKFVERKKDKDDRWVDGKKFRGIQGILTDIRIEQFKNKKGEDQEAVKFIITDDKNPEIELVLSMYINNLSRNILNCLASEDEIFVVNLSGYLNKKKDGKIFDAIGVWVNGKKDGDGKPINSRWKYGLDEQPETSDNDFSAIDEFFKGVIKDDILPKLNNYTPQSTHQPSETVTHEKQAEYSKSADNQPIADDLPF